MIAGIIQARMGSTRLPGKVMKLLHGHPVLWHVVSRLSRVSSLDKIIVATTTHPDDNVIEEFCKKESIVVFRGSENDVLDRYYQCAKAYSIDDIVRITADCPLHDPQVIAAVIAEYRKGGYDYVTNSLEIPYPDGLDVEVFSFRSLEDAWRHAKLDSEREHVVPYILNNPSMKKKNVPMNRYPPYRLTLDYPEDFTFIISIFEGLGTDSFGLDDIITYLNKYPALLTINQHIVSNEGYFQSLIKDAKEAVLQTDRTYLRELTPEDATDRYCQWLNDPDVNRFLETRHASIDELRKYVSEKKASSNCVFYGIFVKENNDHIGNVKLEPISYDKKEATIGVLIGDRIWWGRGICTEVVRAVVDYAFSAMKLNKISLGVYSENAAAIKCYENAGFSIEKVEPLAGANGSTKQHGFIMSIERNEG
jgi:spore coat polysaccharide biosynthesis protein SpsF